MDKNTTKIEDTSLGTITRTDSGKIGGGTVNTFEATPKPVTAEIIPTEPITPITVDALETTPGAIPGIVPKAPVEEVKIEEPIIEPPVVLPAEEPITPEVPTEVEEKAPIQTLGEFKAAGSSVDNLVEFLENSPTIMTEDVQVVGDKVIGIRNGERFEWTIDKAGNPIRKSLGVIDSEKEVFAKNSGIAYDIDGQGGIIFNPSTFDEALDIVNQFGAAAKFKVGSEKAFIATEVYAKYSKYKGATTDIYLEGLKSNEISTGGDTWDRLIKMNGGQPTATMIAAQVEYEKIIKTDAINSNNIELYKSFGEDTDIDEETQANKAQANKAQSSIDKLDENYLETKVDMFENIETMYTNYKKGNEATNELRLKAQDTANKIDEINIAKRQVLRDIQKDNPNMPLSAQLNLARTATEGFDDELFGLQRDYSNEMANYQYADTQDKAEFDFNTKMLDQKNKLVDTLYGVKRTDLINEETIKRTDKLLAEQIERDTQAKKDAIKAGDDTLAKKLAYDIALAKEKAIINKKAFQFTTPESGVIAKMNPNTGEVEFIRTDGEIPTPGITPAGTIQSTDFTTPTGMSGAAVKNNNPGNIKMSPINKELAIGQDSAGHLIFPDMQTGIQALMNDVGAKLEGRTVTGLTPESTLNDLSGVYQEKTGGEWVNIISKKTGYTGNTKLKDMLLDQLIPGIIKAETGGETSFIGEVTATGLSNYDILRPIDKTNTINYLAAKQRGAIDFKKEAAVPEKIKAAADAISLELDRMKADNPGLSGLFTVLSKGGAKLSNEEGANIQKAELEFAITGDKEAFVSQVRNLAQKAILSEDVDIKNVKKNMIQLDRTADLLTKMSSDKWKGIQKELTDMAGLSTSKDFDEAKTRLGLEASAFVKEISGAAVTDEEFQRLSALLPSLGDTPELALNKLAEFRLTRFETLTEPAISLLDNDRLTFELIYPELQGGGVYKKPTKSTFRNNTIKNSTPSSNFDEFTG